MDARDPPQEFQRKNLPRYTPNPARMKLKLMSKAPAVLPERFSISKRTMCAETKPIKSAVMAKEQIIMTSYQ